MNEILDSLDAREQATAFYLSMIIVWCLYKPNLRKSIADILAVAASRPIATIFVLAAIYLIATTLLLRYVELWTLKQFKITVIWFIFAGIPALMNTPNISQNPSLLRAAIASNFRVSLFLDFFINLFKLPLLGELVLVPLMAFLGSMLVVAQSDDKYLPAQRFLNSVLLVAGLALITFEIYKIFTSFDTIANLDTLRDFAMPIVYNLTFIPFLWAVSIFGAYESVFSRMKFIMKDSSLHPYTKRRLLLCFRTDITSLNVWLKLSWTITFTSRSDVDRSIAAAVSNKTSGST